MSTTAIIIFGILAVALLSLVAVSGNTNKVLNQTKQTQDTMVSSLDDYKSELKEIKNLIKLKQKELENLVHATDQAKRRTVTNLTVDQEEAIDLYERNGIKLPIDIIEELSYSNYVTYNDSVKFIEMQRKVWKAQFAITMTKGLIK